MAHKLGAYHHLPHGIANALLIEHVMRFNADPAPAKMGTFSQYPYPKAKERYACLLYTSICEKCKVIKRKGSVRIICENPKHKQRQG